MIKTVATPPRVQNHAIYVQAAVDDLEWRGYHITEVRRVQRSWWGLWADEDITQITYRKGD